MMRLSRRAPRAAHSNPATSCILLISPAITFAQWTEPPGFDEVRRFMEEAEGVMVARLVPRDSAKVDSTDDRRIFHSLRPASSAPADAKWRRQFVKSVMLEKQYQALAACNGCWPCDRADQPVALVNFTRGSFTLQVLLLFRERCAEFHFDQGRGGTVRFDATAPPLLDLFKQALPADSSLQAAALPAAAPSPDTIGAPGQYVYVESLPEAIHKEAPYYPPEAQERGVSG